jgi:hypothetical protein
MIRLLYGILRAVALIGAVKRGRVGRYYARRRGYRTIRRIFR